MVMSFLSNKYVCQCKESYQYLCDRPTAMSLSLSLLSFAPSPCCWSSGLLAPEEEEEDDDDDEAVTAAAATAAVAVAGSSMVHSRLRFLMNGFGISSALEDEAYKKKEDEGPSAAAVEAGEARVDDHLDYFSQILTKATLVPFPPDNAPHLAVARYRELYGASFGSSRGAHFVVHQHDHPVAGTHYDLRLQINETSSASWAISKFLFIIIIIKLFL